RLEARHVEPRRMRGDELGLDLLERERRRVDDACAFWAVGQEFGGHDRAGIKTNGAASDQLAPAHRDEVGRAGTCTDEMHRHGASPESASAQVTGPTAMRGRMSRPFGPQAASAAASATDGTPARAITRAAHGGPRAPAISRSGCAT